MGALLACATLLGCQAAVTTPTPTPEPDPPPLPTLQGTWRATKTWVDDDGMMTSGVQVLTFTGGGRAIAHNAEFDAAGTLVDDWTLSSGWSATADTVTRRWLDDDDDDDETPEIMGEVDKLYYWGEGRQSMFMAPWNRDETTSDLAYWERVTDPLPDLTGTWVYVRPWNPDETSTVTINADGSIMFDEVWPDRDIAWRLTGTVGGVAPDTLIADLSGLDSTLLALDGTVLREPAPWGDGVGRVGFAPSATGILVSPPWDESDPERHPYGSYWMQLEQAELDT
jgi:hypothetical protein